MIIFHKVNAVNSFEVEITPANLSNAVVDSLSLI